MADLLGVIFTFSWPPECQGPSNKLLQKSPAAVTFSIKSGCPKTWFPSGDATIRQSDFKLELSIFAEIFKGAIVQNHVVFTVPASKPGYDLYSEPLYGDWKTKAVVLRNNSRKCQIRLDAR